MDVVTGTADSLNGHMTAVHNLLNAIEHLSVCSCLSLVCRSLNCSYSFTIALFAFSNLYDARVATGQECIVQSVVRTLVCQYVARCTKFSIDLHDDTIDNSILDKEVYLRQDHGEFNRTFGGDQ